MPVARETHEISSGLMTAPAWLTALVSAVAAALVWALSPWLVGYREPWDAEGYFYVFGLLVAGTVAGLLRPRPLWAHYVGALIGQLGYEVLFLRMGPLFIVGAVFLLAYSVLFLVAAGIAAHLRRRFGSGTAHA
jgi:hypothetical protein